MIPSDLPYFFFGTLMDDEVLAIVLGRGLAQLHTEPARLDGFRRLRVKGESYPTLRSGSGWHVDGLLVWDLEAPELARTAFFEGEEYRPIEQTVVRGDGVVERALVFISSYGVPTEGDWDPISWHAKERSHFLVAARAFMQHFGSVRDAASADQRWRKARARAFNR
ncbi:MAG: gamma-glutamylcyclotransferase [Alphaproteobacteria bacterium]|nr:gamma-glutamylcyclotransferase [Alphaproteobacteria bacterium]